VIVNAGLPNPQDAANLRSALVEQKSPGATWAVQ
jgi:hypothetical protein